MASLIIGSTSFLAKETIYKLLQKNESKEIFTTSRKESRGTNYYFDLTNANQIPSFSKKITHAIIFAGITSFIECEINKEHANQVNHIQTCNLVDKLNKRNIRCLFISSSAVFDDNSYNLYEDSHTSPKTTYGILKKKTEAHIVRNPLNTIVRLTKVITASSNLLQGWLLKLKDNKEIEAFSDLYIAPITTYSVVNWIINWIEKPENGIYHITSDNQISYQQLAEILAKQTKKPSSIVKPVSIQNAKQKILFRPKKAHLDTLRRGSLKLSLDDELNKIISSLGL